MLRTFTLKVYIVLVAVAVELAGCSPDTQSTSEKSQQQKLFPECGVSKVVKSSSSPPSKAADAPPGTFPWHAGIYFLKENDGTSSWQQKCAGSLITDQLVLTAAHCASVVSAPSEIRVALGKYHQSWDHHDITQVKLNVSDISIPDDWEKATAYFDIAILLLSEKVKISEHIMPVCLGSDIGPNDNSLYVAGWKVGGQPSDTLLYNSVVALPKSQCRRYVPLSLALFEKFCVANKSSEDAIVRPGDSGGGVTAVSKHGLHFIVGLSSVKINNINFFTNVTWLTHRMWIESVNKKYKTNGISL